MISLSMRFALKWAGILAASMSLGVLLSGCAGSDGAGPVQQPTNMAVNYSFGGGGGTTTAGAVITPHPSPSAPPAAAFGEVWVGDMAADHVAVDEYAFFGRSSSMTAGVDRKSATRGRTQLDDARLSLGLEAMELAQEGQTATATKQIESPPMPEFGAGTLACLATPPGQERQWVTVPLKHTEVGAQIDGFIGRTQVTQSFHNPYDEKIEAVYVFPLPQDAAVSDFIMTVGDRTIRGVIREREEAKRLYDQAKAAGHVASLLQQERPNIFTQKVANIEPGKAIDIDITYFGTMAYRNGGFEYVFPMVVGPRFNPPGSSDPIVAVPEGQGQHVTSGTAVTYLSPEQRSGHDIGLTVELDAGVSIKAIDSPTHAVDITRTSDNLATVTLSPMDTIPNRDFILSWDVAGDALKTAMLAHTDDRGGFFTLMMVPPAELDSLERAPMEMIFVLDCSGSMNGEPLAIARAAVKRALRQMQPGDTFNIIRFAQGTARFSPQPVKATPQSVDEGIAYLDALQAGGGTYMLSGIKAALNFDHDATHVRSVVFMTDGYIGNERDILGEIGRTLGDARIFSFGIGSSPNRYLLQRMADIGRGTCSFIGLDASRIDAMDDYFELISHPAMHDVAIRGEVSDVFPSNIPDVFSGRPVFVTGRFASDTAPEMTIEGRVSGEPLEISFESSSVEDRPALAQIWARSLIRDLNDKSTWEPSEQLTQRILDTALAYNLASRFTSFVAVDSSVVTEGEHGTTVHVPVPVPEGVKYETTVNGVSRGG